MYNITPVNKVESSHNIIRANDMTSRIKLIIKGKNREIVNLVDKVEYFMITPDKVNYIHVEDFTVEEDGITFTLPSVKEGIYYIEIKDTSGRIYPANNDLFIKVNSSFEGHITEAYINYRDDLFEQVDTTVVKHFDEYKDELIEIIEKGEGIAGPQGPEGPPGRDGIDGKDGEQGPQGLTGIDGKDGEQGPQGLTGPQGLPGEDGIDGINGKDGAQGPQGLPGADGADGADGEIGPQGLPGPQGEIGLQGLPGADGKEGTQGPQGLQGLPGTDGKDGEQGPQGEQGLPGADGADGEQGPQGLPGADGKDGEQGPQGLPGEPGPKGDTGLQGEPGPKGEPGSQGIPGVDGADGADGKDGLNGESSRIVYLGAKEVESFELQNMNTSGDYYIGDATRVSITNEWAGDAKVILQGKFETTIETLTITRDDYVFDIDNIPDGVLRLIVETSGSSYGGDEWTIYIYKAELAILDSNFEDATHLGIVNFSPDEVLDLTDADNYQVTPLIK